MNHDVSVLVGAAVAVRVFVADARRLTRRLLGAGVRVGAAQLAQDQSAVRTANPAAGGVDLWEEL